MLLTAWTLSALLVASTTSPALASPLNAIPLRTRAAVGRLTPQEREALATEIAVGLFAKGVGEVDEEELQQKVTAFLVDVDPTGEALEKRVFNFGQDGSPGDGYAPVSSACPSGVTFVRPASGLSDVEKAHVQARLQPDRFLSYLSSAKISPGTLNLNLNSSSPTSASPRVAEIYSGGGYRAMISGGGQFRATTAYSSEGVAAGVGGLHNATIYATGLSGGSWLQGTLFANYDNNMLADPRYLAQNIWNISANLIIPDVPGFLGTTRYFTELIGEVAAKRQNFPTGITDYWALALSSHLFPGRYGPTETPNLTISDLSALPKETVPYVIIVAAERRPGTLVVAANATLWEFTYNEFGTWGFGGGAGGTQSINPGAFTPSKYIGTSLNNAQPNGTNNGAAQCVTGFDNLGFVVGTSSTLFNAGYTTIEGSGASGILVSAIQAVLAEVGRQDNDIAAVPNPFRGWNQSTNPTYDFAEIDLVDAGETNQNLPLEPMLIPIRGVDAVLAFDNSADTGFSWPNGSALWTTWNRIEQLQNDLSIPALMPRIPDTNTFVNLGLNARPTFFGCDANARPNTTSPLIIYLPNAPWSTYSNKSTAQLSYGIDEAVAVIDNGVRTVTLNGTVSTWPTCLACALADRAVARGGSERSQTCRDCFSTWCWNGTYASQQAPEYAPVLGQIPPFLAALGATSTSAVDTPAATSARAASASASASRAASAGSATVPLGKSIGVVVILAMALVLSIV